mgnify:CR=1 FL=1
MSAEQQNHFALLYLVSKQVLTSKLTRWTLLLQEFKFEILHRLGVQHAIADYLSRLELGEEGTGVKDDFSDGQLFRVDAVRVHEINEESDDLWILEMTIFLTTGLPPEHLSADESKRLAVRSRNFPRLRTECATVQKRIGGYQTKIFHGCTNWHM